VVICRWRHQLSYAEIAQVLGISVKTVEAQMGRALATLRTQLARLER
jgi:RNA polymerase sigma-70 factor (ECF subfamily)